MPHPEPDELALAALPAEPLPPDVAGHLEDCARCRAEVDVLRRTVDLGRTGEAMSAAPPPRVWEGIVAELGPELGPGPGLEPTAHPDRPEPQGTPGVDDTAAAVPVRPALPRRPVWRRVAVPAAAAAAGLLLGLGLGSLVRPAPAPAPQPPPAPITSAPLAALSPTAAGTGGEVRMVAAADGRTLVIEVTDPGGEPEGGYFEAWLLGDGSTRLYSLGALTPQDGGDRFTGTFRLPDDLPLDRFDTVDVSAEHYDGDPTHSGESLLRGTL